ncbi:hypothetical protein FEE95_10910 [Maribacter algarum]|uniref:Uncharacterized protein n=1 Tax=Maribacter algarum (ex Zhang et al. 2020) TaxID=2578118 RepID=A0A5S3QHI1_9FLAO|nr:carboxypeptidase-like regulatory domain-containing protein [Maribacter algarum]TMM56995.1 hypothetical protein FEE95_10910 [Maribacter algarum]
MNRLIIIVVLIFPFLTFSQQEIQISGYVTDGESPLEKVNVYIKNSAVGTYTDNKGYYELTVFNNDVLIYSYQGKVSQIHKVKDISRTHNVVLLPEINELDGVTVQKNSYRVRSQKALFDAYNIQQDIVKSKFLLMDKKVSGYSMEIREGDEVNNASGNILAVLQNLFAGVRISKRGSPEERTSPDDPDGVIYLRGSGSILNPSPAAYEVDGAIYQDPPFFVDLTNIKRIAKVPGLAGTSMYGSVARGGLFIINTKSANYSPSKAQLAFRAEQNSKKTYQAKTIKQSQEVKNWPLYLKELYGSKNFESAVTTYAKYRMVYQNESYFVLDVVNYFLETYFDKGFHNQVIDESGILDKKDIELLRGLGLILQHYGDNEAATKVYVDVLKHWPHSPQSYLDLSQMFTQTDKAQKALSIIGRYERLIENKILSPEIDGSHEILVTEFASLVKNLRDEKIDLESNSNETKGTRITFEWNDDQAGFLFHFVDPAKNFFVWDNSMEESELRHTNFPQVATSKEYYIPENAQNGEWKINVNYLGNTRIKPTYLRATIQYDFGLATERLETKLYRLSIKGQVQELFTLQKSNLLVGSY